MKLEPWKELSKNASLLSWAAWYNTKLLAMDLETFPKELGRIWYFSHYLWFLSYESIKWKKSYCMFLLTYYGFLDDWLKILQNRIEIYQIQNSCKKKWWWKKDLIWLVKRDPWNRKNATGWQGWLKNTLTQFLHEHCSESTVRWEQRRPRLEIEIYTN